MIKKAGIVLIILVLAAGVAVAQSELDEENAGEPNAEQIGTDTAQQALRTVSISKFEDPGFWYATMPQDQGFIQLRRFEGKPADKEALEGEEEIENLDQQDRYVLGAKVKFYKRGANSFSIMPVRPLPVEGITKTVSVWVIGRNYNHRLSLIVEDSFGTRADITMGKLNFSGWKKMTVAIPPTIKQRDFHYSHKQGLKILGFRVDCAPAETYGTYYIYFDGLRATTDLFTEENRDPDDMPDTW